MKSGNKIVIVGAGSVGISFAYQVLSSSIAQELVIIDIDKDKVEGEILDLNHGIALVDAPMKIYSGNYSDCQDADIVVITAGRGQRNGESRLDLINSNAKIIKNIVTSIKKYNFNGILLVASNPVDILTNIAWKYSGLDKSKVIGSGTSLDTARMRYLISEITNISTKNVHSYILGEHGDSEFPVWSNTQIYGKTLDEFIKDNKEFNHNVFESIFISVKNAAYDVIRLKGATNLAIGLVLVKLCKYILQDENYLVPVSALCEGEYGLNNIHIGVPCILNRNGIRNIVEFNLTNVEYNNLKNSSKNLASIIEKINLD